jgi:hypothetical protein
MKLFRILFLLSVLLNMDWLALAQEPEDTAQRKDPAIEQLKSKQQPGLALAASKILCLKPIIVTRSTTMKATLIPPNI